MGFDPIYLLRMLTESFSQPLPFKKVRLELIEGDSDLIAEGESFPIYGHINLNPTRVWEKIAQSAGFKIRNYGTYESIRRGGGSKSPSALAFYFLAGAFVYHLLPPRLGRFFGDSTALLLEKPKTVVA